jgi:HEAT repeat protein
VTKSIDWQALVQRLDNLNQSQASTDLESAKRAIEVSLGDDHWQAAVDYCIQDKLGSELARSALKRLRPWPAMQRCYELFQTGDSEMRCSAVELLDLIADGRVLPWLSEFLDDSDPIIQYLATEILDQLVWSGTVKYEECSELLQKVQGHPNAQVRVMAALIWSPPPNRVHAY